MDTVGESSSAGEFQGRNLLPSSNLGHIKFYVSVVSVWVEFTEVEDWGLLRLTALPSVSLGEEKPFLGFFILTPDW